MDFEGLLFVKSRCKQADTHDFSSLLWLLVTVEIAELPQLHNNYEIGKMCNKNPDAWLTYIMIYYERKTPKNF